MAAVPVADPEVEARRPRAVISGEVPSAPLPPPGCGFHTRCPRAMAVCKIDQPRRTHGGVSSARVTPYSRSNKRPAFRERKTPLCTMTLTVLHIMRQPRTTSILNSCVRTALP
jgi:oligopeptide/dipeptide ABC transporter ATP-binding protein